MPRKVYTPELTAEILAFYAENSAKNTADKFGKSKKAIYVLAYKNKFLSSFLYQKLYAVVK